MQRILCIIIAITLTSCGLECIEKKSGIHKSSLTLSDSKANHVFQFEMIGNKSLITLDNGVIFKIKNTWVERNWHYECVNNIAVLKKDSSFQFVIDAEYVGEIIHADYVLMDNDTTTGAYLGSVLDFDYSGEDTLSLTLVKKDKVVEKLKFLRKSTSNIQKKP